MSKIKLQFKNPDAIGEIIDAHHPLPKDDDDITPKMENDREAFSKKYFEYGDYGCIEIDTVTLTGAILPRNKWRG